MNNSQLNEQANQEGGEEQNNDNFDYQVSELKEGGVIIKEDKISKNYQSQASYFPSKYLGKRIGFGDREDYDKFIDDDCEDLFGLEP